jgi:hypothetical protein
LFFFLTSRFFLYLGGEKATMSPDQYGFHHFPGHGGGGGVMGWPGHFPGQHGILPPPPPGGHFPGPPPGAAGYHGWDPGIYADSQQV